MNIFGTDFECQYLSRVLQNFKLNSSEYKQEGFQGMSFVEIETLIETWMLN